MTSPAGPGGAQRWEWRTFGEVFGAAEAAFSALTSTAVQESDEQYLIAPGSDTVKFRNDVMDVKVLREVDTEGLERWEPVLKSAFPLSAADLAIVLAASASAIRRSTVPATASTRSWVRMRGRRPESARSRCTSVASATSSTAARPR